ncbi:MAG: 5-formyltetrahydrofolate cyclo-ligase [Clostridia bacterium]|nr:5-formyltetrahydrofolate cyclo-ligase [Clostridia bacterium]
MLDIVKSKALAREKYSEIRKNICKSKDKGSKDEAIVKNLKAAVNIDFYNKIFVYLPMKYEPDITGFIKYALSAGKKVAAPVCDKRSCDMEFYLFDNIESLDSGRFGIKEPKAETKKLVYMQKQDVCIVPGIAFDENGSRLGYGKGFYDRYFSKVKHSVLKVGVCYQDCFSKKLPCDEFDQKTDIVITESNINKTCKLL